MTVLNIIMDAAAELGRNPVSKHRIRPEYGDEQADVSGTHGDRGILIFPVQLTTSRIGNLTRLIHTLLYVMIIHTYIHTYIYAYYTTVNSARMYMSPNKKYTGTNTNSSTVPVHIYVLTTDTAEHEQVWQPYAVDPCYSAISKWWPYLRAL